MQRTLTDFFSSGANQPSSSTKSLSRKRKSIHVEAEEHQEPQRKDKGKRREDAQVAFGLRGTNTAGAVSSQPIKQRASKETPMRKTKASTSTTASRRGAEIVGDRFIDLTLEDSPPSRKAGSSSIAQLPTPPTTMAKKTLKRAPSGPVFTDDTSDLRKRRRAGTTSKAQTDTPTAPSRAVQLPTPMTASRAEEDARTDSSPGMSTPFSVRYARPVEDDGANPFIDMSPQVSPRLCTSDGRNPLLDNQPSSPPSPQDTGRSSPTTPSRGVHFKVPRLPFRRSSEDSQMEEIVESSQLDEQPGFVLAPATPRKRATVSSSSDPDDMEEVGTSQPTEIEMDPNLTPGQSRKKVFGSPTRSNIQRLNHPEESQAIPSSQASADAISTAVTRDPFRTPQRRPRVFGRIPTGRPCDNEIVPETPETQRGRQSQRTPPSSSRRRKRSSSPTKNHNEQSSYLNDGSPKTPDRLGWLNQLSSQSSVVAEDLTPENDYQSPVRPSEQTPTRPTTGMSGFQHGLGSCPPTPDGPAFNPNSSQLPEPEDDEEEEEGKDKEDKDEDKDDNDDDDDDEDDDEDDNDNENGSLVRKKTPALGRESGVSRRHGQLGRSGFEDGEECHRPVKLSDAVGNLDGSLDADNSTPSNPVTQTGYDAQPSTPRTVTPLPSSLRTEAGSDGDESQTQPESPQHGIPTQQSPVFSPDRRTQFDDSQTEPESSQPRVPTQLSMRGTESPQSQHGVGQEFDDSQTVAESSQWGVPTQDEAEWHRPKDGDYDNRRTPQASTRSTHRPYADDATDDASTEGSRAQSLPSDTENGRVRLSIATPSDGRLRTPYDDMPDDPRPDDSQTEPDDSQTELDDSQTEPESPEDRAPTNDEQEENMAFYRNIHERMLRVRRAYEYMERVRELSVTGIYSFAGGPVLTASDLDRNAPPSRAVLEWLAKNYDAQLEDIPGMRPGDRIPKPLEDILNMDSLKYPN
ncbi:hypothetical protein EIP86_011367 [Pleurotus ostreatoroseus]|nr:hypothetical protein EIP86_011367 [Pleurotus ostreatoroseus]